MDSFLDVTQLNTTNFNLFVSHNIILFSTEEERNGSIRQTKQGWAYHNSTSSSNRGDGMKK